jgi:hypothetical protein
MSMDHNDRVIRVRATDRLGEFVPLAGRFDPAGFTSPANYYLLRVLDFRELLIENPAATLANRITVWKDRWRPFNLWKRP